MPVCVNLKAKQSLPGKPEGGTQMRHHWEPKSESFVICSEGIILRCRCGEKLVLLGLEEDWHSEKTSFKCECGAELTLADRTEGGTLPIGRLLRESIRAQNT